MLKDNEQYLGIGIETEGPKPRASVDVEKTLEELRNLTGVSLPPNRREMKALKHALAEATEQSPLRIYVGSCPDYSHSGGLYTHQSVGGAVPLLTQVHVGADSELLHALDNAQIPYEYTVMVADVEATDQIFCDKFTGGNQKEFMDRCQMSAEATQQYLDAIKTTQGLRGKLRSSSFFGQFGYQRFMDLQHAYEAVLHQRTLEDESFQARVDSDIIARRGLYQKMYDNILGNPDVDYHRFLIDRDIRTKAQYLALGKCIDQAGQNVVIINHPTRNIGLFNDRNKYLLPEDGPQPQRTIPVFEMQTKVY